MKKWKGKDFDYLGYHIKNDLKEGIIYVYDNYGNQICKIWNINHESITEAKNRIENIVYVKRKDG